MGQPPIRIRLPAQLEARQRVYVDGWSAVHPEWRDKLEYEARSNLRSLAAMLQSG